jgi:putative FmdB family regulatory protein
VPLYDYKCPACDHRFEVRHGFNESASACPACGHTEPQRVITSAPTIARGMLTHAGDGHRASKEQLQDKWREETPRLRKQLAEKLGEDAVKSVPTLNMPID